MVLYVLITHPSYAETLPILPELSHYLLNMTNQSTSASQTICIGSYCLVASKYLEQQQQKLQEALNYSHYADLVSQVHHFSPAHLPGRSHGSICVTTVYTPNMQSFISSMLHNHMTYTKRHGYQYHAFSHKLTDKFVSPALRNRGFVISDGLFWQKLEAVRLEMDRNTTFDDHESSVQRSKLHRNTNSRACKWILWVDADIIFTNYQLRLETILDHYLALNPHTYLLMPYDESGQDPLICINNGVFLVKNTLAGRGFINRVISLFPQYRANSCPEQDCMQDVIFGLADMKPSEMRPHLPTILRSKLLVLKSSALPDFTQSNVDKETKRARCLLLKPVDPNVQVISQRIMDSFDRSGYYNDPPQSKWHSCDLIAHASAWHDAERYRLFKQHEALSAQSKCNDTLPVIDMR